MKYAIETFDLTKKYGNFVAVDNLNMKIRDKSIFGFLGPNGAGKTTTIKMLTCLIEPTSGTASVAGHDILDSPNDVREKIGVIPQLVSLYGDLTVKENIMLCADYYGLPDDIKHQRADELMEMVDIKYAENKMVKELSGGMKQKASVVASLIHQPELLFLDEPTIGLDPTTKRVLWDLVEELNSEGRTIILCSHDMYEVDLLCDDVGIINNGKLSAFDTPQGLKDQIIAEENSSKGSDIVKIMKELEKESSIDSQSFNKLKEVIVASERENGNSKELSVMVDNMTEAMLQKLNSLPVVFEIEKHKSGRLDMRIYDSESALNDVIWTILKNNGNITSISTKDPSLEDVFVKVTRKKPVEGE
jgi:ABC-2 type transport system ATP-binding protein